MTKKLMVCCICVDYKDLSNVFDSSLNNTNDAHLYTNLREKIFYCLGIKIDSNCNSNMICISCIHFMNQFYHYKLQAVEVKKFLEDISVLINPNAKAESITSYYRKLKQTINIPDITVTIRNEKKSTSLSNGNHPTENNSANSHNLLEIESVPDVIEVRNIEIINVDDDENSCNIDINDNKNENEDWHNSFQVINDDNQIVSDKISNNTDVISPPPLVILPVPDRNKETLNSPVKNDGNALKPNIMTVIPDDHSLAIVDEDTKAAKAKNECFELIANQHGMSSNEIYLIDKVIQESGALNKISFNKDMDKFIEETTTQVLNYIMQMNRSSINNEQNVPSMEYNIPSETVVADEQCNTRVLTKPVLVVKCKQPIYFCNYCERNFKFQIQLTHHIRKYHLNKCFQCNKSYNSSYSLIRHQTKNGCLINNSYRSTTHTKYADWKLNVKPILEIADFRNPSNGRADISKYTGKLQSDIFTAINFMNAESTLNQEVIEIE